jgi:O-antigen ligase
MKSAVAGVVQKGQANAAERASVEYRPSPLLIVGFCCYAFYLFSYYSGLPYLGLARLHLPAIALWTAIVFATLSGRFVKAARNPISISLLALTGWLFATVPFSTWPGGTFRTVAMGWGQSMAVFAVGISLTATLSLCRRGLYVIGLATAAGALILTMLGATMGERLVLLNSRFGNPNNNAMILLLGLPFLWLMAGSSSAGILRKMIVYATMIFAFTALVRTGSRAGMVALGILAISTFLRSSMAGKLKVVAAGLVFVAALGVFVPQTLRDRFRTIFQGTQVDLAELGAATIEERQFLMSAVGSSQARWNLLLNSLRLTAEHPLFGVGPGNFAAYLANEEAQKGRWTSWSGTHNTYTQLSAEAGIPGVLLFLLALGLCMRELRRVYRRARRIPGKQAWDIEAMALAVQSAFISYMICAAFDHMGYELLMPLMCGIAVAISRTAPEELARLEQAAVVGGPASAAADPRAPWAATGRAMALRPGHLPISNGADPKQAERRSPRMW